MSKTEKITKLEPIPGIPVELNAKVQILDESEEAKNSMLMLGWSDNYAEFEFNGVKGTLLFAGDKLFLDLNRFTKTGGMNPKAKRYRISLQEIIQALIARAK